MQRQCATVSRARRGFNLIEAAIVLGVIGLVIGGIWVAAATVRERNVVTQMIGDLISSASLLRDLFPRDLLVPGGDETDNITIVAEALAAGAFRGYSTSLAGVLYHPLGGTMWIGIQHAPPAIQVNYYTLPRSVCIRMVTEVAARNDTSTLVGVLVFTGTMTTFTSWPIPVSAVTSACSSASNNLVAFQFAFTR